jgi:hypothetical protein
MIHDGEQLSLGASGLMKLDPGKTVTGFLSEEIALHSLRLSLSHTYMGKFSHWCAVLHLYHSPTSLPPIERAFLTSCGP